MDVPPKGGVAGPDVEPVPSVCEVPGRLWGAPSRGQPDQTIPQGCYGSAVERLRLPIGIQTFREIREDGHYYVDKTPHILELIEGGKHYFLSRPRRFGKSLLLDTIKELFEGNRELFTGLHAESQDRWDWNARNPVVRISFGAGNFTAPGELEARTAEMLSALEAEHDAGDGARTPAGRLSYILQAIHRRAGQRVVFLVDEYDKPILDALEDPDLARANRDYLRGLYSVVKDSDAHIRFSLITGVSKFSKVSLFSGLNNLRDITLDPRYATICGYTESDLDGIFAPELPGLDRERIREWYNGYSWLGEEKVYNPFDILLLFDTRRFLAHWFETGTPHFLLDTLLRRRVGPVELEGMVASDQLVSRFDVGDIAPEALLFQTGYLTIAEERERHGRVSYQLGYPNREVRESLNSSLLHHLTRDPAQEATANRLYDLLEAGDIGALKSQFHAFYAGIPHQWYTNNTIASYEGYYAAVFYAYFASLGLDVTVEDSTNHGRLDMALRFGDAAYLFEFKVVEQAGPGAALAQLKDRGYAEKYAATATTIYLIGVEFSSATRNIAAFDVERIQPP